MDVKCALIALDVDGTLLRSDKSVDPETVVDIRRAADAGIHVVYCTGRGVAELKPCFDALPDMRYAVCSSGAVVYDRAARRAMYRHVIDGACVEEIMRVVKARGAMLHFLTGEQSIVSAEDVARMEEYHMGVYKPMYMRIATRVHDMEAESRGHGGIEKINVYFRTPEARRAGYEALERLPLEFAQPGETTLEMTDLGVTKASGLLRLAEILGVPIDQTVGIGDSDNDREMLKLVAHSVAMGNAPREVMGLCDDVTLDNDHNGVGVAIRRIVR